MAEFSDLAYKTAVVVYLVALAVSLFFYGQMKMATDARRQRSEFISKARRDAAGASGTAGGGGSTAGSDAAGSGEGSGSS
ncbi:c-type cytochrome biogenesis protein CcsB, partial [Corynebacterium bovis]